MASSLTVLLIEDDDLAAGMVRFLVERMGHTLQWAPDGESGLRMIRDGRPDLIVLDLMLPYIDGHELLREIREQPLTRDTPVLVLTGKTREADIERVLAAGASDFLAKPFQPAALGHHLERLLKRPG